MTADGDAIETLYARGVTDGLPVVPPTRPRVHQAIDERFDLLGVSGTTDAVAPVFVINGPVRGALDINCGAGALGPGWRANATIGRALRLVWVNVGGALPGVISISTFGTPPATPAASASATPAASPPSSPAGPFPTRRPAS